MCIVLLSYDAIETYFFLLAWIVVFVQPMNKDSLLRVEVDKQQSRKNCALLS